MIDNGSLGISNSWTAFDNLYPNCCDAGRIAGLEAVNVVRSLALQ